MQRPERNEQEVQFMGLMKLLKESVGAHVAWKKATGTPAEAELKATAEQKRNAFDEQLRQMIGDYETPEGRNRLRDWGYYVQRAYLFGLVGRPAFLYVDRRAKQSLEDTAEAYKRGHVLMGRTIEYGVNPRSVQDLLDDLDREIKRATEACDVNRISVLKPVRRDLDQLTADMRKRAAERQAQRAASGGSTTQTLAEATTPTPAAEAETPQRSRTAAS